MFQLAPGIVHLVVVSIVLVWPTPQSIAETWVVNGPHQLASDANPGTDSLPLQTIDRAAQLAHPGDTILVHAGVYRERVSPARSGLAGQPIVFTAAPGERVVIKGSEVWQPRWRRFSGHSHIYSGTLDPLLFAGQPGNPFQTPLRGMPENRRQTLGQVFVDHQPLREVGDLEELRSTPSSWMVQLDGRELAIHFPHEVSRPDDQLVEITTRHRIFAPRQRGLGYIHVRGFIMEHCANQFPDQFWLSEYPQAGALGCRAGHHWQIEHNTVRHCQSIGIDCGYEGPHDTEGKQPTPQRTGYHLIQHNVISDNGCCGIAGMRSFSTRVIGNIVERNNCNGHVAPETGGMKFHYFVDGLIEHNLVRDNQSYGIWIDNVYRNARVTRNVVVGNRGSAVFVELGQGPILIDNNVLADSRFGLDVKTQRADGIATHDASGVTFANNLVSGCRRFGASHQKKTNRPNAGVSRIRLLGNLFIDNPAGHVDWPFPGLHAESNIANGNRFSSGGAFLVNPWSGMMASQLHEQLVIRLGHAPEVVEGGSVRLNLNEWQQVLPRVDNNLPLPQVSATVTRQLVLELKLGQSTDVTQAALVPGVSTDFFGEPRRAGTTAIGPFNSLSAGMNRVQLWPAAALPPE